MKCKIIKKNCDVINLYTGDIKKTSVNKNQHIKNITIIEVEYFICDFLKAKLIEKFASFLMILDKHAMY